jgi:hypothetical protein
MDRGEEGTIAEVAANLLHRSLLKPAMTPSMSDSTMTSFEASYKHRRAAHVVAYDYRDALSKCSGFGVKAGKLRTECARGRLGPGHAKDGDASNSVC